MSSKLPSRDASPEYSTFKKSPDLESNSSCSATTTLLPSASEKSENRGFRIDARVISDAIIGLSDGLTVPFALTAGLSALGDTKVVIYGGLAELTAGAISMGLGGYLGAKSEAESYHATRKETEETICTCSSSVSDEISAIFAEYGVPASTIDELTTHLLKSSRLPDFLMRFQHTQLPPESSRAFTCALTIAMGYFLGGFIPLLPYFFVDAVQVGLQWSICIMAVALFTFGYVKTCFVGGWRGSRNVWKAVKGGVQIMIIGGVAAGSAMALVKVFDKLGGPGTS